MNALARVYTPDVDRRAFLLALGMLVLAGAALAGPVGAAAGGAPHPAAPSAVAVGQHPVDCLITSRPLATARCETP